MARKNLDQHVGSNFDLRGKGVGEPGILEVVKIELMAHYFLYSGTHKGEGKTWAKKRTMLECRRHGAVLWVAGPAAQEKDTGARTEPLLWAHLNSEICVGGGHFHCLCSCVCTCVRMWVWLALPEALGKYLSFLGIASWEDSSGTEPSCPSLGTSSGFLPHSLPPLALLDSIHPQASWVSVCLRLFFVVY